MPGSKAPAQVGAPDVNLALAGHRLRLVAGDTLSRAAAVETVTPPCAVASPSGNCDWTLRTRSIPRSPQREEDLHGLPALSLPGGGPELRVTDAADGMLQVAGVLHPDQAVTHLTVDRARRETVVHLPDTERPNVRRPDTRRADPRRADAERTGAAGTEARWVGWLARVYFGSRLLAAGWQLLHAAAITFDTGVVLVLAGPWGGKSTLAHRACRDHGAALLADDLVFLGPDGTVVGWPTQIALPVSLCTGTEIPRRRRRVIDGEVRDRALFTPPEYRRAFDVRPAAPAPLAGIVVVGRSNPWQTDRLVVEPLDTRRLHYALDTAGQVAAQKLHLLDLLGLTGNTWHVATGAAPSASAIDPRQIPGVFVRINDPGLLETWPVWNLIQDALTPWRWAS